ncbi:NmrA/HSCARG family protein [Nonomuraea rosea]|uniref:NmrA/HSCARG family protein n=1 Tax=Nonomuraea rosea TaxID=638574 RepID=A0ABP6YM69_9ACTN
MTTARHDETILVTGATGRQGGAVAAHLLADGWRVRALVRDASAPAALGLAEAGADLVVASMDDSAALVAAMRGAYGVFSVQPSDEHEAARGIRVADAAAAAGARHLLYSSMGGADKLARHAPLDKWRIESHVRALGIPATILRPAAFMEDLTGPYFGLAQGRLTLPYRSDLAVQLIAVDDIGAFAALAFARPDRYAGQALDISGDALTPPQIADALSRAAGRTIPLAPLTMTMGDQEVTLESIRQHSPEATAAFDWANTEYYTTNLADLRRIHPKLMDLDTWLATTEARRGIEAAFAGRPD